MSSSTRPSPRPSLARPPHAAPACAPDAAMMHAMDDPARHSASPEADPGSDMTEPTRPDAVILPSLETPTLTKAELAELLFDRIGLNKRESKDIDRKSTR